VFFVDAVAGPRRCSPALRALGVEPNGTAPLRTSFLLVESPLPWPRDIGDDPALAPLAEATRSASERGERWRLQALVPDVPTEARRVIAYTLPNGSFDRYERREAVVAADDVAGVIALLVREPNSPSVVRDDEDADLLVCTHGRHDVCCGAAGTALWKELVADSGLPSGVHVWRTSHTGGHRFAPTAIHLPTGTCWAWLDAETVKHVLRRDAPFGDVSAFYRGSCALASVEEQVVERAVLERVGWSWLDHRRAGRVLRREGERAVVELDDEAPDGARGTWWAETRVTGRVPIPDCGRPSVAAKKHAAVIEVVPGTLVFEHEGPAR
jgi:hypothetical protein